MLARHQNTQNNATVNSSSRPHGGAVVSLVPAPHSKEDCGFDSLCLLVESTCSPCDCGASFQILRLPPTLQKHICEVNWEAWISSCV